MTDVSEIVLPIYSSFNTEQAVGFTEKRVNFYQATRCHISESGNIQTAICLKKILLESNCLLYTKLQSGTVYCGPKRTAADCEEKSHLIDRSSQQNTFINMLLVIIERKITFKISKPHNS